AVQEGDNRVDLPIPEDTIDERSLLLERRQQIDRISDKHLPAVKIRLATVKVVVEGVSRGGCGLSQWDVRDGMAPGGSHLVRQPVGEAAVNPHLKQMVRRVASGLAR